MSSTKPQPPQKPDIYKYKEIDSFRFEFSSFKDSILFLFFGFLATWYLASGQGIENFIHGIVLLVGVGLGIAGVYLFFHSFQFPKKTIRISKTQAEIIEDNKSYEKALIIYREKLESYNNKLRQEEELKRLLEKQRQEEIKRQQILAEQKKIAEQKQKELEEKQKGLSKVLSWQSKVNKLTGNLKPDWKEFVKVIESNKIEKLYHFTDSSNIASIKANDGLYSWWLAEQKGISIAKPGGIGFGRNLDARKGLQNHVRLSFNKRNPMLFVAQNEGRILNPVFLEIDPIVMLLNKTLFTKENATKNGVYPNATLEFFKEIVEGTENDQSSIVRQLLGSSYLINPKAEILVFERIPLEFITNINEI